LEGQPCSVWGQPEQLQRLFTNVLLNAMRVSPPQGVVQLQLRVQAGRVRVEVRDGGPGIAPLERSLVFERFWRGNDSPSVPSAQGSHSGLGLPIARAIARRHGGELSLASGEPGACCFLVDLPAA
jgi:two-component system sensor histidine kinase GlrK